MPKKRKREDVRWRSHDVHRIESFSDAVFAFAVTLLVVSLEVPKTFQELYANLYPGMMGFFIGFVFLMLIWHDQYLFFRRYGLRDTRTIVLTALLLFVVLFYIYPTKFLFTFIFSDTNRVIENGVEVKMIQSPHEMQQLIFLYCLGFTMVYFILWQTYRHAWKMSDHLHLTLLERFITQGFAGVRLSLCFVGALSIVALYLLPPERCLNAPMTFFLIYPISYFVKRRRKKLMKKLFTAEEIESNHADLLVKDSF